MLSTKLLARKVFTILLFFGSSINGVCCLSASQFRIFPIGSTDNGILVAEIHLHRTEGKEFKAAWIGGTFIKEYGSGMSELSSIVSDTIALFPDSLYEEKIALSFAKSVDIANKLFVELRIAEFNNLLICNFQTSCFSSTIEFDSINRVISLKMEDGNLMELTCLTDSNSIASPLYHKALTYGDPDPFEFLENNIYINSIRSFKIGDKDIFIYHFANGQSFNLSEGGVFPPGGEAYKTDLNPINIKETTFLEEVLHHGIGFDLLIIK